MNAERFSFNEGRRNAWSVSARSRLVIGALLMGLSMSIVASTPTAPHPAAPSTASPSLGDEGSPREIRLLMLAVNQHREAIGCKPLIWDERLARLARKYSESMATKGFFGHIDPDGNSPFDRMRHAGIHFLAAGENLAVGQTKGIQVYGDWLNSPAHRAVIENCVYTHHGIGFYRNRWSYLFARY